MHRTNKTLVHEQFLLYKSVDIFSKMLISENSSTPQPFYNTIAGIQSKYIS